MADIDQVLDCKGMNCPMPIVALTRTIKTMQAGQRLEIEANDLAFKMDLEAWSRRTGNEIESFVDGEVQKAIILVAEKAS